jgi:4-hydroxybenzoate polyprenyltransferase
MGARIRLAHPFPSLLNGVVVLAMALVAGATPEIALRLAVAMTLLQVAIGTLNDVADAPRDGGRTPLKPIPAGLVSIPLAKAVSVVAAVGGLLLVAPSGAGTVAIALAGLGCGVVYDLALSRTAISWLPLAIALPLVPIYAWLGATGALPLALFVIVPMAALAGGGLAIGNALVDVEADRASSRATVAVAIGMAAAWRLHALTLGSAVVLAVVLLPGGGSPASLPAIAAGAVGLGAGILLVLAGTAFRRRLAWQLEAAGVASIGVGWILAIAGSSI